MEAKWFIVFVKTGQDLSDTGDRVVKLKWRLLLYDTKDTRLSNQALGLPLGMTF